MSVTENEVGQELVEESAFAHDDHVPVVVDRRSKKKTRKRRTSAGLRDVQDLERGISRAVRRAARAASKGATSYEDSRRSSARKKKDGAIRDFVPNMGEALSDALREASEIPAEVTRALDTKSTRRQVKRRTRQVSKALRAWQP